jgi:hypothetical protein
MRGYEQFENSTEIHKSKITGMTVRSLPYFEYGQTENRDKWEITGHGSEDARLSYMGRFNYGFDNRYLVEFSFRQDASVKFDPDHRWGFFPSGSAAWRVSEESFFKKQHLLYQQSTIKGQCRLDG